MIRGERREPRQGEVGGDEADRGLRREKRQPLAARRRGDVEDAFARARRGQVGRELSDLVLDVELAAREGRGAQGVARADDQSLGGKSARLGLDPLGAERPRGARARPSPWKARRCIGFCRLLASRSARVRLAVLRQPAADENLRMAGLDRQARHRIDRSRRGKSRRRGRRRGRRLGRAEVRAALVSIGQAARLGRAARRRRTALTKPAAPLWLRRSASSTASLTMACAGTRSRKRSW